MDLVAIIVASVLSVSIGTFLGHMGGIENGIRNAEDRIARICGDGGATDKPSFDIIRDNKVWTFQCGGVTAREFKPWDKQ